MKGCYPLSLAFRTIKNMWKKISGVRYRFLYGKTTTAANFTVSSPEGFHIVDLQLYAEDWSSLIVCDSQSLRTNDHLNSLVTPTKYSCYVSISCCVGEVIVGSWWLYPQPWRSRGVGKWGSMCTTSGKVLHGESAWWSLESATEGQINNLVTAVCLIKPSLAITKNY